VLLADLVETSAAVGGTASRLKKIDHVAACLRRLAVEEHEIGASFLAGEVGHKLGVGYAIVHDTLRETIPARGPYLTLGEVDRRFGAIAGLGGAGSGRARREHLGALLQLATAPEQQFLAALAVGELRQGALDGVVVEAIAKAAEVPADSVRRAYMLAGNLGAVAAAALGGGAAEIGRFGLTLFRPVLPMLAKTADSAEQALQELGRPIALEYKLDGFRVQLHKDGDEVRAYSRALNDVSAFVPELIAKVAGLPARRLVLDGEAIVLGPGGRPLPFQDTMRRFRRPTLDRGGPERGQETRPTTLVRGGPERGEDNGLPDAAMTGIAPRDHMPLQLALFDVLQVDDQPLLGEPTRTRLDVLGQVAGGLAVARTITGDAAEANAFYAAAIDRGHEGVMAKALDAPYDAGSRGAAWLKIKKVHRLDLVVLAAEWGGGRRKGWLSNIHLGARDAGSGFVMLGKTFKGMTDEILKWQTAQLLAREVDRDGHIVYVRPELVAEIAFNDVQRSPRYPGGLALRLARLVRYRDDKTAADADTIDAVRAIAIAGGVLPGR
jgi:DNA ligase-1